MVPQKHEAILILRTAGKADVVPGRPTYCADQNRIAVAGFVEYGLGAKGSVLVERSPMEQVKIDVETHLRVLGQSVEHLERRIHDFRANSITGQGKDLWHCVLLPPNPCGA